MINRQLVLDILKEDGPKFRHSIAFYSRQKQRCTVGLCLNRFGLMPEESNDTTINSDHWTRSLEKFKNELNRTDNEFKKIIQEMEDANTLATSFQEVIESLQKKWNLIVDVRK
jgi:hypothetical protein